MDCVSQYRDALQAVFGPLDWLPMPDGTFHRFHVPGDKPGTLNGWYVLFLDGIACGVFGSWKAGGLHTWSSRQPADHYEDQQIALRIRLREWMRQHGTINTFEAIRLLNILRHGARIAELRAAGHNIITHLGPLCDDQGREHQNVATYYLSADPAEKVAA